MNIIRKPNPLKQKRIYHQFQRNNTKITQKFFTQFLNFNTKKITPKLNFKNNYNYNYNNNNSKFSSFKQNINNHNNNKFSFFQITKPNFLLHSITQTTKPYFFIQKQLVHQPEVHHGSFEWKKVSSPPEESQPKWTEGENPKLVPHDTDPTRKLKPASLVPLDLLKRKLDERDPTFNPNWESKDTVWFEEDNNNQLDTIFYESDYIVQKRSKPDLREYDSSRNPYYKVPKEFNLPRVRQQKLVNLPFERSSGIGGRKRAQAAAWVDLSGDLKKLNELNDDEKYQKLPWGTRLIINGKSLLEYFKVQFHREIVLDPLIATETLGKFNVTCQVHGGGTNGQAQALRMAISQALENFDPDYRAVLKKAGFLSRDMRKVERKKPGQPKARKKKQWSKR